MTVIVQGDQLRAAILGTRVTKSTGTLTAATLPLFTVSGEVFLTSIYGKVTTAVTVANAYKLQHNPTGTPTTVDLCTTLDIGTTDSVVGEIFSLSLLKADAMFLGPAASKAPGVVLEAGQIEHVSAGTDGVILWALTYVPMTNGASIIAA